MTLDTPGLTPTAPGGEAAGAGCRSLLRHLTKASHQALEDMPVMSALASGAPTAREYRAYLLRSARLIAPLEARLRSSPVGAWAAERLVKSAWLLEDLGALGVAPRGGPPPWLPAVDTHAQAMGALYVLEGGTLGQQVIAKRMRAHDARALVGGQRYVQGYGADTGRRWRCFVERLDRLPDRDWLPAADAAVATFDAFRHVFEDGDGC